MREVDGILDFLEEYGLLPPTTDPPDGDLRTGEVEPGDGIVEVDWEALTDPNFVEQLIDEQHQGVDADIIGSIGRGRDRGEERRLRELAVPAPWDTCAWYASMHHHGPAWGIYIREDCVQKLAFEIAWFAWDSNATRLTAARLRLAAFFALFLHEHFHHKLEGFGIRLALADRVNPDHYVRYDTSVYRTSYMSDDNLEEALANADAYRRLGQQPYSRVLPSQIRAAMRRWLKWRFKHIDPPGYKMARHYLKDDEFVVGARLLQTQVLEAALAPKSNPDHWQAGPSMLRSIFPVTSDIYLVLRAGAKASVPTRTRPYTVSVRKTEQWLRQNGFTKLPGRGKGDHERYERDDGTQIGLDGTARELSRQIERTAAKALGLSQRQFRDAVAQGRRLRVAGTQ